MKILIVDDDPHKIRAVASFVAREWPLVEIIEARSFNSGLRSVVCEAPDLVLLDMTMPTFDVAGPEDGGKERRYAGEEILRQIRRRNVITKVIVVTQFERFGEGNEEVTLDELKAKLRAASGDEYLDTVFYQAGTSDWMTQLADIANETLGIRSSEMKGAP